MKRNIFESIPAKAPVLLAALTATACANLGSTGQGASMQSDPVQIASHVAERSTESEIMFELMAGEIAGHLGKVDQAVSHYIEAAQLSSDPRVAQRATRIAVYAEADKQALTAARRWVELKPNDMAAHQALGLLYVRQGRYEQALPHFQRLLDAAPPQTNGFMLIASSLGQETDLTHALKFMQRLVARNSDSAGAWFAQANLAVRAGRYEQAVEAVDRALTLDPGLIEARILRAQALLELGEENRALTDMAAAVEKLPDNRSLREVYGRMLLQAERYGEARAQFGRLLEQTPDDPELLYTLGLINLQDEHFETAESLFTRLLATDSRGDEARYYLGRLAEQRERSKAAIDWYRQVGQGDYYFDAQARIGALYVELEDMDRARAHLRDLRKQSSDESVVVRLYLLEGQLLREASRYQQGLELYGRALTEHPGNEDLLYARALMAENLGRLDLLEADLQTILAQDPNNATALNALGYTLADRDVRIQEALGYITRALEVTPNDPAVIDSMGWVQFRMGNYNEAEDWLRRALSLQPDPEIAGHLSEAIWAQGEKVEARNVLRQALEKNPEHEYLLKLKKRFTLEE